MDTELSQVLYNYVRDHQGAHVIVDPLAGTDWINCFGALTGDLQSVRVCHDYFDKDAESAPRVLYIPFEHFDVLEGLADLAYNEATDPSCQTRSVCAIVVSVHPPEVVARVLGANSTVRIGSRKIYFRLHDPRVMHYLPALLPNGMSVLSGIESWAYFDWEGNLSIYNFCDDLKKPSLKSILLSEQQWLPFERLPAVNASVVLLKKAGIPCPCSESEQIMQAVAEATRDGVYEPTDVATYLLYSRQSGCVLAQHPRWPQVLELVNAGASLSETISGFGISLIVQQ